MVRFLVKLLIVCFPALLLIFYLEFRLSRMDTHYYTKSVAMEKQLGEIEILSLGSSNGYYGIDPAYFSHVGYNLAFNSQSPYYDYQLLAKYIDRMPKLKVVILPAIFYTLGTDMPQMSESWRMYFYRQYFGIPLQSDAERIVPYDVILEPKNFSKIALYGSNIYHYIPNDFKDKIDYDPENNGWFNADAMAIEHAKLENKNGEESAAAHNQTVNISFFKKNIAWWQRIADLLKEKNIKLIIVRLPSHSTYYTNLDPKKISEFQNTLTQFAALNHIIYVDYTKDPRFTLEDYTFMIDHMNSHGAAKFGAIFNREQLEPLFRSQ
jgi:RNase H-fold protein (predicted Holliday junction resolvase)